jgi:MoxR-like ATPase
MLITEDTTKALRTKLHLLEKDVNRVIFERSEEVHTALLALIARRHHFQLGPPGVAKSMLVEQIIARIDGLDGENYFKWLLTKFSKPEELFGGPFFKLLSEEGVYKLNTERKLPRAKVAFLDETLKAGSSLLNTLLTIINEGEFYNVDDDPSVPLVSLFGASNEGPQNSELEALVDRFMFWHLISKIKYEGSFNAVMSKPIDKHPAKIVDIEELYAIQNIVSTVEIPDEVLDSLWELRGNLEKIDIFPSDRRFHQCIAVIQAEAFLNGRMVAEVLDTKPLQHCMWRDVSDIERVRDEVLKLADPLEREAKELLENMEKTFKDFQTVLNDSSNKAFKTKTTIDTWSKIQQALTEINALKVRETELGRKCPAIKAANKRRVTMCKSLLEDGIGLDGLDPNKFISAADLKDLEDDDV